MLVVVAHADVNPERLREAVDEGRDRPVADALELVLDAVDEHPGDNLFALTARVDVRHELVRSCHRQVVRAEGLDQLRRRQLAAARVGDLLHLLREVDLEAAWQLEVVVGLQDVGDPAFPGLGVDADDRLVGPPHVLRVDRQVRNVPDLRAGALLRVHALLDRVLVRARERGVDELADVRMPRVDGQLVALLDDRARLVDPRDVEPRLDALREQVERDRDEIDVARPLAVAEQRPLDALGAGHQSELGRGDGGPAVVVRVDGEDGRVPAREVPPEPLDPVGVDVGREVLDRRRQVDDHRLLRRRGPFGGDRLADLERVLELGVVEALG